MSEEQTEKYREIEVTSVIQVLQELQKTPSNEMFRGQSDAEWTLVPKVGRMFISSSIPDSWERLESFMLGEFIQHSIPYIKREPRHKFEWLVLGQHYGLPTRLLDWTSNPLKALFWAVSEYEKDCDSALFCFSPTSSIYDLHDSDNLEDLDHVMPIFPKMIDSRVISQEACFILFPFPEENKAFEPLEDESIHGDSYHYLTKMIIPRKYKFTMSEDLKILGVSSKSLFPDLTGLAQFIEDNWKGKDYLNRINQKNSDN